MNFFDPGELRDGDLRLILHEAVQGTVNRSPAYRFYMTREPSGVRVGRIELRISNTPDIILYVGHIGYNVDEPYRGNRYAARSCWLLYDLARMHGFTELWITCDPENVPSRRTCELAGGIFVSIVPVPPDHPFYKAGSFAKCRFRIPLAGDPSLQTQSLDPANFNP